MLVDRFSFYAQLYAEPYQRASLLLTQARCARMAARCIVLTGESTRLHTVDEIARQCEDELEELLCDGILEDLDRMAHEPESLGFWQQVIEHRVRYNTVIQETVTKLRQLERLVSQESAAVHVDVTPPTIYHGIKQQDFLLTTRDVATHYYQVLIDYANRSVLQNNPLRRDASDVLIAHSYLLFPRQRSFWHTSGGVTRNIVIARMPIWYGYLARFHPNIAHEMAHAVVRAAVESNTESAGVFRTLRSAFRDAITALLKRVTGAGGSLGISNLEEILLDECLCDVMALRVSGPAFLASLMVSVAGLRDLSSEQELELPLSVRVAVLLQFLSRWYPDSSFPAWAEFAQSVERHLELYTQWHNENEAHAKANYQQILTELLTGYIEKSVKLWGLDQPLEQSNSERHLEPIKKYIDSQLTLKEFDGVSSPTSLRDFEETLKVLTPLAVGPNLIWMFYIINSEALRRAPGGLPEGRIFHEWNRIVAEATHDQGRGGVLSSLPPTPHDESGSKGLSRAPFSMQVAFGTYWELLFLNIQWPSTRSELLQNAGQLQDFVRSVVAGTIPPKADKSKAAKIKKKSKKEDAVVGKFSVVGGFDIATFRQSFKAKEAGEGWPPVHTRYAYFMHRHLLQEVTSVVTRDRTWTSRIAGELNAKDLLACTQVKYPGGTTFETMLGHVLSWQSNGNELIGIFRSLHWDDLILVTKVTDLANLHVFNSWRGDASPTTIPLRTNTQLLLPVDSSVGGPEVSAETAAAKSTICLSVHGRIASPDRFGVIREALRGIGLSSHNEPEVLLCLGQDDMIVRIEVATVEDLNHVLQTLYRLKSCGDLISTTTRVITDVSRIQHPTHEQL